MKVRPSGSVQAICTEKTWQHERSGKPILFGSKPCVGQKHFDQIVIQSKVNVNKPGRLMKEMAEIGWCITEPSTKLPFSFLRMLYVRYIKWQISQTQSNCCGHQTIGWPKQAEKWTRTCLQMLNSQSDDASKKTEQFVEHLHVIDYITRDPHMTRTRITVG